MDTCVGGGDHHFNVKKPDFLKYKISVVIDITVVPPPNQGIGFYINLIRIDSKQYVFKGV